MGIIFRWKKLIVYILKLKFTFQEITQIILDVLGGDLLGFGCPINDAHNALLGVLAKTMFVRYCGFLHHQHKDLVSVWYKIQINQHSKSKLPIVYYAILHGCTRRQSLSQDGVWM